MLQKTEKDSCSRREPTDLGQRIDYVFWPGSIGNDIYKAQLEAAAAGGFSSMAMHPFTFMNARQDGMSDADMRVMADDLGVAVRHLDCVTNWARPRRPEDRPPTLARHDVPLDICFEIAEVFEMTRMNVIPAFYPGTMEIPELAECFGNLCDRALRHGMGIDVEFVPCWGIPNLATAWKIVGAAGRDNGGILIDSWHFYRSNSAISQIGEIPGKHLVSVQISDAPVRPAVPDLYQETISWRRFLGEGELPNADLLRALAGKGHLRHIGAEIFSTETAGLTVQQASLRQAAGLNAVLTDVGLHPMQPIRP